MASSLIPNAQLSIILANLQNTPDFTITPSEYNALYNVAVESGQSALKGNQAGYKLGIKINIDVLNAQYETLLQGLKLKASAGALGEADFEVVNGMLH
jgi:hypothetical protein